MEATHQSSRPAHPLACRRPLVAEDRPPSLHFSAGDAMLAAFQSGRAFDGHVHDVDEHVRTEFDPVTTDLLRGAFLCGYGSRSVDKKTGRHQTLSHVTDSCEAIKCFVRAFLAMRPADRQRAFVAAKEARGSTLVLAVTGALCEAHAASVLLDANYFVLETTAREDINLDIDCLAVHPNLTDGYLVQAKGNRDAETVEFVPIAPLPNSADTWKKAARFNVSSSVSFLPLLARVGTRNGSLFAFRRQDRLDAALASLSLVRGPF